MNAEHFRRHVIAPTLDAMGLWSAAAETLLLGTAVHESMGLHYLDQVVNGIDDPLGPAIGLYQIEQATHEDVRTYLTRRPDLGKLVNGFLAPMPGLDRQLATNLCYATAIVRIIYWRRPERLPSAEDLVGLAQYWKAHFNTPMGAGTPQKWLDDYERYVLS